MPDFRPLEFIQTVEIVTHGCEHFVVIIFWSHLSREWAVDQITPVNASLKTSTVEEAKYVGQLMTPHQSATLCCVSPPLNPVIFFCPFFPPTDKEDKTT